LTITGENGKRTSFGFLMPQYFGSASSFSEAGAGIGTDAGEKSSANLIIHNVTDLTVKVENGAGIGSGENGSIGSIYIEGAIDFGPGSTALSRSLNTFLDVRGNNGAGIGAGVNG
jgi:hypothetical protein